VSEMLALERSEILGRRISRHIPLKYPCRCSRA
jgi:hypothetical protein